MAPSLDTGGRNAVIADGNILIKAQLWRCDAPVSTPIPAASAQNRIDRLVIRLTRGATTSATVVVAAVVTGTPSGSPVIPALTQTPTGIWEFPVSHWTSTSAGALTGLIDDRLFSNDPWHGITVDSGWTVIGGYSSIRYRMDQYGGVQFSGGTQHTNSASTLAINSSNPLPPAYWPTNQKVLSDGNNPLARYCVEFRQDGVLYAVSNSNTPTATQAIFDNTVPFRDVG
jgi:hypothetical protein